MFENREERGGEATEEVFDYMRGEVPPDVVLDGVPKVGGGGGCVLLFVNMLKHR